MVLLLIMLSIQEDKMSVTIATNLVAPPLHIGERCRFGNLDWFPVWRQGASAERPYKTNTRARLQVVESIDPDHTVLEALNLQDEPLALFEGTLFREGYQHRALTRTIILEPHRWTSLPVVCVEKGRWAVDLWDTELVADVEDAFPEAEVSGQMAPLRIRHAIRGVRRLDGTFSEMFDSHEPEQSRVWDEVSKYEGVTRLGTSTSSLVELENHYRDAFPLERSDPLPGQTGVIVAHGGYPLWMECFDHPDTLRELFPLILESVRLDAHELPYVETPSRRARRFAHIVNNVDLQQTEITDELARLRSVPNPYVVTEAWTLDNMTLHLTSLNAQHALFS